MQLLQGRSKVEAKNCASGTLEEEENAVANNPKGVSR
jgi:hypothetical protein